MHVGYSVAMTNALAPDITEGYPSKGRKVGPAWNALWEALRGEDYQDGRELSARIAAEYEVQQATLVAMLSRAHTAGLLDKDIRMVKGTRGDRPRSFYKIAETV